MHKLEVGERYHPDRGSWPEVVQYNYRAGHHELMLFLNQPTAREIQAVKRGQAEFFLVDCEIVLVFGYRFGRGIPWGDAIFQWHRVPEKWQQEPPEEHGRALLEVILVDASTGIIKALRGMTLSEEFSEALMDGIRAQVSLDLSSEDVQEAIEELYQFSSEQLAEEADIRCVGGTHGTE